MVSESKINRAYGLMVETIQEAPKGDKPLGIADMQMVAIVTAFMYGLTAAIMAYHAVLEKYKNNGRSS